MFKVGDKVKILPSARDAGILEESINKIGVITAIYDDGLTIYVKGSYHLWALGKYQIEPAIPVGTQLMFPFMYEEELSKPT